MSSWNLQYDSHGFAKAIAWDAQAVLHLQPGTEFNIANAVWFVRRLNALEALKSNDVPSSGGRDMTDETVLGKDRLKDVLLTALEALMVQPRRYESNWGFGTADAALRVEAKRKIRALLADLDMPQKGGEG